MLITIFKIIQTERKYLGQRFPFSTEAILIM